MSVMWGGTPTRIRTANVNAHNKFVKLPNRQSGVSDMARAPSLREGAPQPESALVQSLRRRIAELESLLARPERPEPNRVFIRNVIKVVCDYYDLSRDEILSRRRSLYIVRPRQIAIYLARKLTKSSLPEIGNKFGGLDHTTCLHATRKVEELVESDPEIFEAIEFLKNKLSVEESLA